jgi:hypothetical protein
MVCMTNSGRVKKSEHSHRDRAHISQDRRGYHRLQRNLPVPMLRAMIPTPSLQSSLRRFFAAVETVESREVQDRKVERKIRQRERERKRGDA